jgi:hypothetical protein
VIQVSDPSETYPESAFAPDGTLWWQLDFAPGTRRRFGDEQKLAAWLAFNVELGETFTMKELRQALGEVVPNHAEHLNRRLRNLRPDGWSIPSNRDDGSLNPDEYRLAAIGWHPGEGRDRPPRATVSLRVQRRVFERDGRRCVICGLGSDEFYEDGSRVSLTVGHRYPNARRGAADENNLQTECRRCNEPVRDELAATETLEDVLPELRLMGREAKSKLESWLLEGRRVRDRTDEIYDRLRRLSSADREAALDALGAMLDRNRL